MKVLITDEQSLFRDGLSLRLKQINQDIAILQSSNLVDMQKILSKEPDIDILIVDIDLAELNAAEIINKIKPGSKYQNSSHILVRRHKKHKKNFVLRRKRLYSQTFRQ